LFITNLHFDERLWNSLLFTPVINDANGVQLAQMRIYIMLKIDGEQLLKRKIELRSLAQ